MLELPLEPFGWVWGSKRTVTMLIEVNWGNFRAKFNGREQKTFEWLCSLLFYKEHGCPTGALRYFNQPGIEAEPITVGTEVIGWQAKFIGSDLSKYKAELIRAIDTAKSQHPTLTQLHFYVNLDFGRSNKQGVKDPKYKSQIEAHAKAKEIAITWKTASFFETPFVCETNAAIAGHFFDLGGSVIDFIQEIARHTATVLTPIHSAITVEGRSIKIDRKPILSRLKDTLSRSPFVIVSGEAGVGKTAIIKDLYDAVKARTPFFVFKATEFNLPHINQLFRDYGAFTISDFIHEHEDFEEKYIVVDSAEKLSDLDRPEVFQEFLSTLRNNGWRVLFTTRLNYLEDLKYAFIELYRTPFEPLNIRGLTQQELLDLSAAYGFSLPKNVRLCELLQNPFYLNEYLRVDPKGRDAANYAEFRDIIWNRQIARSSYQKENIHRKREEQFLEIARRRAVSGHFFVSVEKHDEALRQLASDEIIKFDSNAGGYFITHDIYEEWALERIIERSFRAMPSYEKFYEIIGDALAIRRGFRGWLSEKLAANDGNGARLIEATVGNSEIPQHWKDEAIVAAMLSSYSGVFIQFLEKKLLEPSPKVVEPVASSTSMRPLSKRHIYDKSLLYRLIFLLRIACKEVDQEILRALNMVENEQFGFSTFMTKPKGSGWNSVIRFLNQHKEKFGQLYIHVILPVLDDWNRYNKQGETTKAATQIALYYLAELTKDGNFPYSSRSELGEQLIRVILSGSAEAKEELGAIFKDVVARNDIANGSRYYELIMTALSSIDKSAIVAASLPKEVTALASVCWPYTPPVPAEWSSDYRDDMEQHFDLSSDDHNYYPASAFQTPTLSLLRAAPLETVNFILSFTNRSVEYFAKTIFAEHEVEEVDVFLEPSEPALKQYICNRIWNIYRGTQMAPTLLESVHMALEHWLLDVAKSASPEVFVKWCLYLIKNSRSASITAVVVSAVLAQPSKLFNVAKVLFRTKEFFFFDLARKQLDMSAKSLFEMSHDPVGLFTNERLQTCDDKHRQWSLEDLALNYQIFRIETEDEAFTKERQEAIWAMLDAHYAELPDEILQTEQDKTWRLSIARMDRRKMTISSETNDGNVLLTFNPEIDPELRKYSEDSLAKSNKKMQYTPFMLWARNRWEGNSDEYSKYAQYDNDHKLVVADIRAVCERLRTDNIEDGNFTLFYHSNPPVACAVLLRDFADKLDAKEKQFCKEKLFEYSTLPLQGGYAYQIGDGIEVAIIALPLLLQFFPEFSEEVKGILLFSLLDRHPLGMSNRFSDYAVTSIVNTLRKLRSEDADALFLAYLYLQPKFAHLRDSMLKEDRRQQISQFEHSRAVHRFAMEQEAEIEKAIRNEVTPDDLLPLGDIDVDALVTAFLLLPQGTQFENQKIFVIGLASIVAEHTRRHARTSSEQVNHSARHRFLEKFAYFVLGADRSDIPRCVKPFIDNFKSLDYTEDIFKKFVSAEDKLNHYDSFWLVWEQFYPCIVEGCKNSRGYHLSTTIHNYLLAWPWWIKDAREWHSLREREKGFFKRVAQDVGNHPAVLYSLAKVLNEIGTGFVDDGIFWISTIFESHPDLHDEELETNTVYYLENLIRGYVLLNREKVRTTPQVKSAVLNILDFLLVKGSVTAYLTRENIL